MAFDANQMKRVARLARLRVDDEQLAARGADVDRILGLFAGLADAPVDGVQPMAHPLDINAELRADVVSEVDQSAVLLALAPDAQADLYCVPRVIE